MLVSTGGLFRKFIATLGVLGCAYLFTVDLEEGRGVHAICDGAADEGEPVEDQRRLVGVLEEGLGQDIEDDGEDDDGEKADGDLQTSSQILELVRQWSCDLLQETHPRRREKGSLVV